MSKDNTEQSAALLPKNLEVALDLDGEGPEVTPEFSRSKRGLRFSSSFYRNRSDAAQKRCKEGVRLAKFLAK